MPQNETAFLLTILNEEFPDGIVDDDHPMQHLQSLIKMRLLAFGLIAECSADHNDKWYVRCNDGQPYWDK